MRNVTQRSPARWLALAVLSAGLVGCGSDDQPVVEEATCTELDGECVGVPLNAVCTADPCIDGVACTQVLSAANDAELGDAITQASAGDCITLAPGSYGAVPLPDGVSLLGRSAKEVSVGTVSLAGGSNAWVRGLSIEGGLDIGSATEVQVEAVSIHGGQDGLAAGPGASVTLVRSQIDGAARYGVWGEAATSIAIEHSIITAAGDGGIWTDCDPDQQVDPCTCAAKPDASLDHVLLTGNGYLGAGFRGTAATLRTVHILETHPANLAMAGGLSASHCSELDAANLRVVGFTDQSKDEPDGYGVLVDGSSASFGADLEQRGIIIVNTKRGLWLQRIGAPASEPDQSVSLDSVEVSGCYGTGIGLDLEARGIIIVNTKVADTFNSMMPIDTGSGGSGAPTIVGLGVA